MGLVSIYCPPSTIVASIAVQGSCLYLARRGLVLGFLKNLSQSSVPLLTHRLLNSECSQQNRANENKHGTYRQRIELERTVIGLDEIKHSKLPST
jgi:hypothetical protein